MLKLMYITNDPQVALIAEHAGVDRIFVDMETVGKELRQGGMDTVPSRHIVADAARLRRVLARAELLVRVNPIYPGSEAGIDECFVGLNDLHLGYGRKFMFELLADGTTKLICRKFAQAGKPYGFGGIARVGTGTLSADRIIGEHVRLGSTAVILSRSFCNTASVTDPDEIREIFEREVPKVRQAVDHPEQYEIAVCNGLFVYRNLTLP